MSYDIVFKRRPDQDGESAFDALQDDDVRQRIHDRLVEHLGEVRAMRTDDSIVFTHLPTRIHLELRDNRVGIHVQYGAAGSDAVALLLTMYLIGRIVEEEIGLEGYDLQVDGTIREAEKDLLGVIAFDGVAERLPYRLTYPIVATPDTDHLAQ